MIQFLKKHKHIFKIRPIERASSIPDNTLEKALNDKELRQFPPHWEPSLFEFLTNLNKELTKTLEEWRQT